MTMPFMHAHDDDTTSKVVCYLFIFLITNFLFLYKVTHDDNTDDAAASYISHGDNYAIHAHENNDTKHDATSHANDNATSGHFFFVLFFFVFFLFCFLFLFSITNFFFSNTN